MHEQGDEAFYESLFENLGMAVIATDVDYKIRTWNAAATRVFGAAADRMMGTPIVSIIPQDRRRAASRMLRRTVRTGETIQFEFQHRDAQGTRRELVATIAPVVSGSGERVGASISVRDITKRIALQSELSESRKMASLGEMAGAISHHFNNILGSAVVSIDYARSSDDVAVKARVLDQLAVALQRATTLVDGLLAFAEGDRRTDALSDIKEVINDLADEFKREVEGTEIEFTLSISKLPPVPVPRVQFMTICRNIVRNAIEAMTDGGKLHVDVSANSSSCIILFEDTGCGLDEAAKSRVFEPFWTTKGVLASGGSSQATGLGLAIAHGLVNMLRGTISVTSQVGKGSCFRVTLPITD